ncbi:MAG: DUF4332 domain-containing protein [Myxococcota bacterium]|nr:DUF4332 domain-containing protein [Myxococcota bacterium]
MTQNYHLDANKIGLKQFEQSLGNRPLIPSRMPLKKDLARNFERIQAAGIGTLKELLDRLKNKQKLAAFAKQASLSIEYLTLLRREANSYFPNPVRLSSVPDLDPELVEKLSGLGINNTKQLFERANADDQLKKRCQETSISLEKLNEAVQLSDLSRLYGVGPVFARLLHDMGICSVRSFVEKTPEQIVKIYEEKTKKKADFSAHDIRFTMAMAKALEAGCTPGAD